MTISVLIIALREKIVAITKIYSHFLSVSIIYFLVELQLLLLTLW